MEGCEDRDFRLQTGDLASGCLQSAVARRPRERRYRGGKISVWGSILQSAVCSLQSPFCGSEISVWGSILQSPVCSLQSPFSASSSRLLRHRWRQQHSAAGRRPLLGAAIRRCWLLAGTLEIVRQAHERGTVPLLHPSPRSPSQRAALQGRPGLG